MRWRANVKRKKRCAGKQHNLFAVCNCCILLSSIWSIHLWSHALTLLVIIVLCSSKLFEMCPCFIFIGLTTSVPWISAEIQCSSGYWLDVPALGFLYQFSVCYRLKMCMIQGLVVLIAPQLGVLGAELIVILVVVLLPSLVLVCCKLLW